MAHTPAPLSAVCCLRLLAEIVSPEGRGRAAALLPFLARARCSARHRARPLRWARRAALLLSCANAEPPQALGNLSLMSVASLKTSGSIIYHFQPLARQLWHRAMPQMLNKPLVWKIFAILHLLKNKCTDRNTLVFLVHEQLLSESERASAA